MKKDASQTRLATHTPSERWIDLPVKSSKFIDNLNGGKKCDITDCASVVTTRKVGKTCLLHARKLEAFFNQICLNATNMGMCANPGKMQLHCTTTVVNYNISAYIVVEAVKLISDDKLKTIGYTLGRRPGASEYIKEILRKFGARAGILRHLKKIGI